ncbi:alpha/beta hydrolase family protein [Nocardia sp. NPDC005998]|uniref:alpha/beta hydrolase n=1 Tax=Nocardia sp. NPDC005998 TaxID=3156894 RepID=UPI0033B36564
MAGTRVRMAAVVGAAAVLVGFPAASGGFLASAAGSGDPIISSGKLLASSRSSDGSYVAEVAVEDNRNLTLQVYSAAMDKNIEIQVQRPADTTVPRPTLYLLNGAGGGEDSATWQARTDAAQFFDDKNVNVITPVGGHWSYYTDWRAPDPELGVNKWKTFLTQELPPLIDSGLGTNGTNAIAGLSMSGTSVLQLPIAAPGLYKSVAAYSGCAQISDPVGYNMVNSVVAVGGGDSVNMYGPQGDPMWAANDPYVHADQLRGLNLFVSDGNGMPGQWDTLNGPHTLPGVGGLTNQVALGGALEAATNYCSHNLQTRLNQLGIPATYDFQPSGTHSWGYWQDALKSSWPVLAQGLGLPS